MTRRVLTDCEWHKISRAGELTDCEECGSKHRWATRGLETDTCPNIDHAPNSVLRAAACLLVGMVEGCRALRTSAWDEGSKFLTWWPDPSFWVVSRSKRESGSLVARTLWNELVLWDSPTSLKPSLGWHHTTFSLWFLCVGLLYPYQYLVFPFQGPDPNSKVLALYFSTPTKDKQAGKGKRFLFKSRGVCDMGGCCLKLYNKFC